MIKENIFSKILKIFFSIVFSAAALFILINSKRYFRISGRFDMLTVLLSFVLFCALIFLLSIWLKKYYGKNGFNSVLKISVFALSAVLVSYQIAYITQAYTEIGSDIGVVVSHASGAYADEYMLRYPNNQLLAYIYKLWFKIFRLFEMENYWLESAILNVIIVDAAVFFLNLTAYKFFSKKVFYLTFILSGIIIAATPYLIIPYSDTAGVFFPVFLLYLALSIYKNSEKKRKYLLYFLFTLVLYGGYKIKPTIVIGGVILLTYILLDKKIYKKAINAVIVFLCLGLGFLSSYLLMGEVHTRVIDNNKAFNEQYEYILGFTPSHYVMMGLQVQEKDWGYAFGAYHGDDVSATIKVSGKNEKTQFHTQEIKTRLKNFGACGYLRFLVDKFAWTAADGTFGYYGVRYPVGNDAPLTAMSRIESPFYSKYYANFMQGIWLMISLLCAATIIRKSKNKENAAIYNILRLSILGLIAFLLLFEAHARYLFVLSPYIILMSGHGFDVFTNYVENKYKLKKHSAAKARVLNK